MYVVSEAEPITTNYKMEVPAYYESEITLTMAVDYEKYDYTEDIHPTGDNHISKSVVENLNRDVVDTDKVLNFEGVVTKCYILLIMRSPDGILNS